MSTMVEARIVRLAALRKIWMTTAILFVTSCHSVLLKTVPNDAPGVTAQKSGPSILQYEEIKKFSEIAKTVDMKNRPVLKSTTVLSLAETAKVKEENMMVDLGPPIRKKSSSGPLMILAFVIVALGVTAVLATVALRKPTDKPLIVVDDKDAGNR